MKHLLVKMAWNMLSTKLPIPKWEALSEEHQGEVLKFAGQMAEIVPPPVGGGPGKPPTGPPHSS